MAASGKSLEAWFAALTVGGRMSQEKSRAQPWYVYRNPEQHVKLSGKREVIVDRMSDREQADSLLVEWFRWANQWRPNLGAPRIAPYCRQSESSKQYDSTTDLTHDRVHQKEMEAVEFCVDALAVPLQQAIGSEMRNREVNAKVWRNPANRSYSEALEAIVPVMKKRGLFD